MDNNLGKYLVLHCEPNTTVETNVNHQNKKGALTFNILRSDVECNGRCKYGKHIGGGKYVCTHNNLKVKNPQLAAEWNYSRNLPLRPEDVLPGSGKTVWWKCENGSCECHEWESSINNRNRGRSCPACSNPPKKLCPHNKHNLMDKFPNIAAEFDYIRNFPYRPEHYFPGSNHIIWWICDKCISGDKTCHSWQVQISSRTLSGISCPFCAKQNVCIHSCISVTHPALIKEWDFKMNEKGPENYSYGSGYKAFWNCPKNHVYQEYIHQRTSKNLGCPFCPGKRVRKVIIENSIITTHPEICEEWNYELNKLGPEKYSFGTQVCVYWNCPADSRHVYISSICNRTRMKSGCPICSGNEVIPETSIITTHPEICKEWNYKLNKLGPENYSYGSGYKAFWNCIYNQTHIYSASIYNRIGNKSGCPSCRKSHGEKECMRILSELGIKYITQGNPFPQLGQKAYDFILPDLNVIIEYDGLQHFELSYFCQTDEKFEYRRNIDILKHQIAIKSGYRMIRIDYTVPFVEIKNQILIGLNNDNIINPL